MALPNFGPYKTRAMRKVEQRIGRSLEDYLAAEYATKTQREIAASLLADFGVKVNHATVNRWMSDLGIEARFPGQKPEAA